MPELPSRVEETPLTNWMMLAIGIAIAFVVGAIVWFAIPGPDTSHTLTSPSGAAHLELAEQCGESACTRVAIFERDARRACEIGPVASDTPVFATVSPQWSDGEDALVVTATDADGAERAFTFTYAECTQ